MLHTIVYYGLYKCIVSQTMNPDGMQTHIVACVMWTAIHVSTCEIEIPLMLIPQKYIIFPDRKYFHFDDTQSLSRWLIVQVMACRLLDVITI